MSIQSTQVLRRAKLALLAAMTLGSFASISNAAATPSTPQAQFRSVQYQLTWLEPSESRAYQRPAQSIEMAVAIQPALQAGDKIVLSVNGQPVGESARASIATVDLGLGEQILVAEIISGQQGSEGRAVARIEQTVYVIQNTVMQQRRQHQAAVQAYERLPLYHKLYLNMRQDVRIPRASDIPTTSNPRASGSLH